MEKRILSYDEYKLRKATLSESIEGELNEGFLDAIVRFFKGMFDLFNNKKLRKESEESSTYFREIADNEDIADDEIAEEIDMKRVRRTTEKSTITVKERIDVEKEKGIRVSNELTKRLAGWFAQIITVQDTIMKMPAIQKMLKNTNLSKRFVWVPSEFRENATVKKDWYSDKNCVLDKTISNELLKVFTLPIEKQDEAIQAFSKKYIEFVAKSKENGLKKLKENDPDFLDDLFAGFALMTTSIAQAMSTMLKNTPDDKAAEIIAEEIIQERKRKSSKKPGEKPADKVEPKKEDAEEEAASSTRVRKGTKKAPTMKASSKTSTKKDTTKKETTA